MVNFLLGESVGLLGEWVSADEVSIVFVVCFKEEMVMGWNDGGD